MIPEYIKNPRGHAWKRDADGDVDEYAWTGFDEDGEELSGPECVKCGYVFCIWLDRDEPAIDCKKPEEEG